MATTTTTQGAAMTAIEHTVTHNVYVAESRMKIATGGIEFELGILREIASEMSYSGRLDAVIERLEDKLKDLRKGGAVT